MKKIKLFLVFVLMLVLVPAISSAQKAGGMKPGSPMLMSEEIEADNQMEIGEQEREREMHQGEEQMNQEQEMEMEMISAEGDKNVVGQKKAEARRSRVANAVQEMVRAVEGLNNEIGNKIRTVAEEQKQDHEKAEEAVKNASRRGGFARFFIGPNYNQIKDAEKYVEQYTKRIEGVREIPGEQFENAIQEMEQARDELVEEIDVQKGGFSLFGWLNRILNG